MDVVLQKAKDSGSPFSDDLPLSLTLDDVRTYRPRPGDGAPTVRTHDMVPAPVFRAGPLKGGLRDTHEEGEATRLLGVGKAVTRRTRDLLDIQNAVGFFLYVHCRDNAIGTWPADTGVILLAPCSQMSHMGLLIPDHGTVSAHCTCDGLQLVPSLGCWEQDTPGNGSNALPPG